MNPWQNPSIELFGIRVDEPITTLTDIFVSAVGVIGFFMTAGSNNPKHITLYRYFFLVTAISTFVSSLIGHAFAYNFTLEAKIPGWLLAIAGVTFAQFAALFHCRSVLDEKWFKVMIIMSWIETVFALILVFVMVSFHAVEIHSVFTLLLTVTSLEAINFQRNGSILSRNMVFGVGFAAIAVMFHLTKIGISNWFNHLDISHVFMTVGMYLMCRGVYLEQRKIKQA
jgi:hypothetical protein